jgi:ATP-binding cassette subfamily B protein RaxB
VATSIRQNEHSECGLACIAMIAGFHGLDIDLATLRRKFGISQRGVTLQSLIAIGQSLGLSARPVRAELEDVEHVIRPAIVHWDLNHFVVLADVKPSLSGNRYLVNDPGRGTQWLDEAEFSSHFTGVALELLPTKAFLAEPMKPKLKIRQLWSNISGLKRSLATVLALSIILQILALGMPYYMQLAVDSALPAMDLSLLKVAAFGFFGLAALQFATTLLRSFIITALSNAVFFQLVSNLSRHLLKLPLAWFEKRHKLADLHDTIMAMPLRYDTFVGDMGSSLSGGQRQRVLLARALYRKPSLLLMDEGTAHLDPGSEARVISTVKSLPITRVVIAHRLASISAADRVLMMAAGSVMPVPHEIAEALIAPKPEKKEENDVASGSVEETVA